MHIWGKGCGSLKEEVRSETWKSRNNLFFYIIFGYVMQTYWNIISCWSEWCFICIFVWRISVINAGRYLTSPLTAYVYVYTSVQSNYRSFNTHTNHLTIEVLINTILLPSQFPRSNQLIASLRFFFINFDILRIVLITHVARDILAVVVNVHQTFIFLWHFYRFSTFATHI